MDAEVQQPAAGDSISPGSGQIEIHVAELKQLFNAMDPSPFRKRDLDPKVEEFIVSWAKEAPRDAHLAMVVHLDRSMGRTDEAVALGEAIHGFFIERARVTRQRLHDLLRRGRISLLIGILTLLALFALSDVLGVILSGWRAGGPLRESLLIGGWVAMWRPLEIFLYDWWPIRADARLYDRLARMPVRIIYENQTRAGAWKTDWPAVPPGERTPRAEASPP
jgi:hypothetical protein